MKKLKIILIEDDQKKIEDIKHFLSGEFGVKDLMVKESYQSGLRELIKGSYDLLLLDMSIPTWDKAFNESGGDYQKFGGYMIMKELSRKEKLLTTILISMFDDFGESDRSITLSQIDELFRGEFPNDYLGSIFYGSGQTAWKRELKKALDNLV